MKASELTPGMFFEWNGERYRALYLPGFWCCYMDKDFHVYTCLTKDTEVTAVAGWDDEPQPSIAKELNIDAGTEQFELARALHRVVRAMHDGHCPKCGHLASSMEFEPTEGYHVCPECEFAITKEESDEALAMFLPFMQKNYDKFVAWQLHGRFVKQVAKQSLTTESVDPGEGYRLLQPGEAIQKGDEWLRSPVGDCKAEWKLSTNRIGCTPSTGTYRRKVDAPLQLREGAYYRSVGGEVYGPMIRMDSTTKYKWSTDDKKYLFTWTNDGKEIAHQPTPNDLIAEVPPPVEPEPEQFKAGDWVVCVDEDGYFRNGGVYEVEDVVYYDSRGELVEQCDADYYELRIKGRGNLTWMISRFRRATPAEVKATESKPTDLSSKPTEPDADGWIAWQSACGVEVVTR